MALQAVTYAESTSYPPAPESEPIESILTGIDTSFCSEWNPEYQYRGFRCCYQQRPSTRRNRPRCSPKRVKTNFCDEMTDDQRDYTRAGEEGRLGDVLDLIGREAVARRQQAYCNISNGFLVHGRRLVPTPQNRIRLKSPTRCIDFGTDPMVGMLEWVGRKFAVEYAAPEYAGVHFLVGDISAPRGGCLSGRSGRRGHASHTSGQDVDVGFLQVRAGKISPYHFSKDFDPKAAWWQLKQIFANPHACVKVVFLDRKLIGKLARVASGDPEWAKLGRFVRHVKYHKNHFHIRVGEGPGEPGCKAPIETDEELDESGDDPEASEVTQGMPKPIDAAVPQAKVPTADTIRTPAGSSASRASPPRSKRKR